MARMIPATISPDNESKAEAKLFRALKNSSLDDPNFIFHSFDLFTRNLDNRRICEVPRHFPRATRHASAVIARRESAAAISTNNC